MTGVRLTYFQGYTHPREYIVTEWPLPNTCSDIWSLVYDHDCSAVVVLCNPTSTVANVRLYFDLLELCSKCNIFGHILGTVYKLFVWLHIHISKLFDYEWSIYVLLPLAIVFQFSFSILKSFHEIVYLGWWNTNPKYVRGTSKQISSSIKFQI